MCSKANNFFSSGAIHVKLTDNPPTQHSYNRPKFQSYTSRNGKVDFETGNSIHTRANQHRSDISIGQKNIPTVRHFQSCGRNNLKLTVIERVRTDDRDTRLTRERYWIETEASHKQLLITNRFLYNLLI